jgi:hypothetical protein
VIPLNQLIPECLLALGGAFLLGNLAAYIRLRPAWRDAKRGRGGQAAERGASATTKAARTGRAASRPRRAGAKASATGTRAGGPGETGSTASKPGRAGSAETTAGRTGSAEARPGKVRSGGVKAAAKPRAGSSKRVNARVREPTASGSKLPSQTRVLVNMLIGLMITVAALATLIRG